MSSSSISYWPTRICSGRSSTRSSPRNGQVSHRTGRAEAPKPSDVPAGHGDAARELRDPRGGHTLYGSAAGRGNVHLPATSDKPTTRKAGDFPLLLIHPTRGDCSPRPPCFRHSASDRTLRRPRRPRTHPAGRTGQPPHAVVPAAQRPGPTTTTNSTRS